MKIIGVVSVFIIALANYGDLREVPIGDFMSEAPIGAGAKQAHNDKSYHLRLCHELARYIEAQYVTLTSNKTLTVPHDTSQKSPITRYLPAIYDVTFQHKGYEGLVSYCLTQKPLEHASK